MNKVLIFAILSFSIFAQDQNKKMTVFFHGLNNKPIVFNDLIKEINNQSTIFNHALPADPDLWLGHVKKEIIKISSLAAKNNQPWQIIAFSLGGLLVLSALEEINLSNPPINVVLLAPAITPQYLGFLNYASSLLPEGVTIPSFAPSDIRAKRGVSIGEYAKLFSLAEKLQSSKKIIFQFPIKIFYSAQDELVDPVKLIKFCHQNGWWVQEVKTLQAPHHLLVQKGRVSQDSWLKIKNSF